MKAISALLAVVWLLFGLTATAHAVPQGEPSCHMAMHHNGKTPAPQPDASLMPCCSQPAALPALAFILPALSVSPLRHEPRAIATLTGIFTPQDPRPPQNG
ncbi:hypothetical protein [Asticcacaulis solisilvae]|uniref:hypothetical protein n=1 Tax=Asticcacaulis solisilvae TaxID=1217274 RepID=UPI003FD7F6C7